MGALTELRDKHDNEMSYYYAKDLYKEYRGEPVPRSERERFPEDLFYIDIWYERFSGRKKESFGYYIPWFFAEFPESVDEIMDICAITEGVSCEIRTAKEDDFFMFRPTEPYDLILIVTNDAVYDRRILNLIFGNIRIHDPETVDGWNYMRFTW